MKVLPKHIAIVMDGNGRWAKKRALPRIAGHRVGIESVRCVIKACIKKGIEVLTLFAFSTENWGRPQKEITFLMGQFFKHIASEIDELNEKNVQFRVIGEINKLDKKLQKRIHEAEKLTAKNNGLKLVIALSYSGRWDIVNAAKMLVKNKNKNITEEMFHACTCLHDLPDPDLFIRTSNEMRISNFLLWQLAYTELYFTKILWPDFREKALNAALLEYAKRNRRFGLVK